MHAPAPAGKIEVAFSLAPSRLSLLQAGSLDAIYRAV